MLQDCKLEQLPHQSPPGGGMLVGRRLVVGPCQIGRCSCTDA